MIGAQFARDELYMLEARKVLVTGGAGFIGSHLAERLLELGCNVSVADNLSRGTVQNIVPFLSRIRFYETDLTSMENCLSVTKDVDYVFHLASSVGGVQYIRAENVNNLMPSVLMNMNMLEAARICGVERFAFTSSACVYREKNSSLNRFKEGDAFPADPPTTYGWAKVLGEVACRSYHQDYGIKCAVVRIFNAYGEKENLHPRWSHVVPSLIRKAILYPKEKFRIFGDGNQERAFLYIKDCVEGIILAMERISDADPVNLGGEEVISIRRLAQKIVNLSRKDIEIEFDLSSPPGVNRYCADTTKMKNVLNWRPRISLEEGLKKTYQWAEEVLAKTGGR